jgi:hypothetical protein
MSTSAKVLRKAAHQIGSMSSAGFGEPKYLLHIYRPRKRSARLVSRPSLFWNAVFYDIAGCIEETSSLRPNGCGFRAASGI